MGGTLSSGTFPNAVTDTIGAAAPTQTEAGVRAMPNAARRRTLSRVTGPLPGPVHEAGR
jgi:hypothetical protein